MPETVIDTQVLEASDGEGTLSDWLEQKKREAFIRDNQPALVIGGLLLGGLLLWSIVGDSR